MNRLLTRITGSGLDCFTRGLAVSDRRSAGLIRAWKGSDVVAEHPGIARSLDFLRWNCCRPIGVGDLVVVAGLSRRGFLKAFRKHTGHTPGKVLRHLRIEHAKRLLVEGDIAIEDAAERCGFRRTNSFGIAFRQVTGVAPTKFQRQVWLMRQRSGSDKQSRMEVAAPRIVSGAGCRG